MINSTLSSKFKLIIILLFCYALYIIIVRTTNYPMLSMEFDAFSFVDDAGDSIDNEKMTVSQSDTITHHTNAAVIKSVTTPKKANAGKSVNKTKSERNSETVSFNSTASGLNTNTADNGNNFTNASSSFSAFHRYDDVVIVTKVLWPNDLGRLKSMLCYLSAAYNDRVKYDIVVFTTMPWSEEQVAQLREVVAPAQLVVAVEGPPLEEQVAAMTKEEADFLRKRCNATDGEEISWFHHCTEEDSNQLTNLGYSWQAEFRAYHIWTHPAIMNYKYMMWFDADVRFGKKWDQDPMKMMIENDLTILFAGFPYGKTERKIYKDKMEKVYNYSICDSFLSKDGHLNPYECKDGKPFAFRQIAGNHHITNLEVYRQDVHQKFLKEFVGDYRFSREADDQIAVTIPAVFDSRGIKAWHERSNGLHLMIMHHGMYDVQFSERGPKNKRVFWKKTLESWPSLKDRCQAYN